MRRLDQILSSLGYCSRSEARSFAKTHEILVDGARVKDCAKRVNPNAVSIDGEPLEFPEGLLIMMHKPLGLVCSHDAAEGARVYDLLPERWRRRNPMISSVGRLDKATSGLLLLTDISGIVHQYTSPKHKVPKVYVATLDKAVEERWAKLFESGELMLEGEEKPCAPAFMKIRDSHVAELTLTEGRYHQVRRMFAAVGASVEQLHREKFGRLELGQLREGEWRIVDENEI